MVTYKHVTEVVRTRCPNHQAKSGFKGDTSHNCNLCWGLNNLITKQKNTNIANQTDKLDK